MRRAKLALLGIACAVLAAGGARAAEVSAEKRAVIEQLMEITGALALGKQLVDAMTKHFAQTIRQQNPNAPQYVIDAIPEEVNAVLTESLPAFKEMVIPIYDKYFTLEELQGLEAFYATPLGKKTITVMPSLLQDSMHMGMRFGEAMVPRIDERLRTRFKKEDIKI